MYSIDYRKIAIRMYSILQSLRKTAHLLDVHHTTVYRWVNQVQKVPKEPKRRKEDSIADLLRVTIESNPFLSIRQFKQRFKEILNVEVSVELVRTAIQRIGYTRKKARYYSEPTHQAKQVEEFIKKREAFKNQGRRFLSVDETCFGKSALQTMGYAPKGERLFVKNKAPSQSSISAVACASSTGWLSFGYMKDWFDRFTFLEYLKLVDFQPGDVLLLDNVKFHHSKIVTDYLASKEVEILYVPVYSPWFNPIELCFSIVKRTYGETQDIEESFKSVRADQFDSFFRKALDCTGKY